MGFFFIPPLFGFVNHFLPLAKQKHPTNGVLISSNVLQLECPVVILCPCSELEEFYPYHTGPSRITFQPIWETWGEASGFAPHALHDVRLLSFCAT